jgi:AcrR family transcriptional regulator
MPRLSRTESQQQTRQRLLDAAQEIFARSGFAAASVDDIAEHAGYSKGAVYSNFKSKEALFLELLHNRMSQEIADLEQLLKSTDTAEEILSALRKKYSAREDQMTWCLLSTEFQLQAGRNPDFAEPFAALYRDQRKAIARLAASLAEKMGRKLTWSGDRLATSLMALTTGISLQRAADPQSISQEAAAEAIQFLLAAALGTGISPLPNRNANTKKTTAPKTRGQYD